MFTERSVEAATRALQSVHGSTIRLYPEFEVCQVCGEGLHVYKTKVRSIVSLAYGFFHAQEIELYCPNGCVWDQGDRSVRIYRSQFLANLVAPWHTYTFDVVAKVGTLRFLDCRQRVEIQTEIEKKYGLFIPEGTIQELISRFVDTIRALHEAKVPVLRESFEDSGGYILYVDGTCEEGSQVHFVCLTGPEPIALWSEKIDSENAIQIRRVLQEVDNRFGRPAATVEDLSSAIENAVREQWPNIPIFYCHQHFLSDVGKDILDDHYKRLRALLRRSEIRPELARFLKTIKKELGERRGEARWICQHLESPDLLKGKGRSLKATSVAGGISEWILSARAEGTGRGFPYDLPHLSFYLRIQRALEIIDKDIVPHLTGRTPRGEKLLLRLRGILHCFLKSRTLAQTVRKIQETNEIFMRLRDSLRLAAEGSAHGMNAVSTYKTSEEAREAEEAVIRLRDEFRKELQGDLSSNVRKSMEIILRHLDKYWDGLFGHCLNVSDAEERYLMVQRTNNLSERFFRGVKRFERRITGKKKLNREVDALPGHALLVFNLKSPSYVNLVCGSLEQLPQAFAELARQGKFPKPSDKDGTGKILDRKNLRRPDFPNSVAAAFVQA
jgi:hypothetical protein